MCSGGGSKKQELPNQPYRDDPNVAAFYTGPAPGSKPFSKDKEWQAWESAYYNYQKAETTGMYERQFAQQEAYIGMQERMMQAQMAQNEALQKAQIESQQQLAAMEQEMQNKQLEFQKQVEAQQTQFAKDSKVMEQDNRRKIAMAEEQASKQAAFQAGRDNKNRKNQGSLLATRGTNALQVGLGAPSQGAGGLAIPA